MCWAGGQRVGKVLGHLRIALGNRWASAGQCGGTSGQSDAQVDVRNGQIDVAGWEGEGRSLATVNLHIMKS